MSEVHVLGAGQHIGRSAFVVKFDHETRVLFDCGIQTTTQCIEHQFPGLSPYFRPSETGVATDISLVLITHYHLDHVGALPYLTETLGYSGPIIMTPETLAQARLALHDCWVSRPDTTTQWCDPKSGSQLPQNETHQHGPSSFPFRFEPGALEKCLGGVLAISLNSYHDFRHLRIHVMPAGHVLGACMYHVVCRITGKSVLYTGDFTLDTSETFHVGTTVSCGVKVILLCGLLQTVPMRPTLLICESTYASQSRELPKCLEREFCGAVDMTLRGHGNVLIPVNSTGKAQEFAGLLCSHLSQYDEDYPVILSKGLMGDAWNVAASFASAGSYKLDWSKGRHLLHIMSEAQYAASPLAHRPVVYICVPRSMNSGPSHQLFYQWCTDPRNLILLSGYPLPNTVAFQLLKGNRQFARPQPAQSPTVHVQAKVRYIPIGSHADATDLQLFVRHVAPSTSMLVHGEAQGMQILAQRLRETLLRPVLTPQDGEVFLLDPTLQFLTIPLKPLAPTIRSASLRQLLSQHASSFDLRYLIPASDDLDHDIHSLDIEKALAVYCPPLVASLDAQMVLAAHDAISGSDFEPPRIPRASKAAKKRHPKSHTFQPCYSHVVRPAPLHRGRPLHGARPSLGQTVPECGPVLEDGEIA